jgi:hypothetical protein
MKEVKWVWRERERENRTLRKGNITRFMSVYLTTLFRLYTLCTIENTFVKVCNGFEGAFMVNLERLSRSSMERIEKNHRKPQSGKTLSRSLG